MAKKVPSTELNILKHFLVPKMEILSEEQKRYVLKKYAISATQLTKMKSTDPAAVALGARTGDIIRIERKDPPATYFHYRIVVD